eukprot:TRINITY_DN2685_c0_g1_i1.p1 TRINITY_DN2685_c0_g1~~TRINITY_DN2685_c0_g1_i1.p1  ORF type:complete len:479 (+),score=101.13 TRINITY_DN2685_c0_g1_i1:282-1718(+)
MFRLGSWPQALVLVALLTCLNTYIVLPCQGQRQHQQHHHARPKPTTALVDASSIVQQVQSYGYHCEKHSVVTEDGVTLNMLHIPPYGRAGNAPGPGREVVFLQHGLIDSAATWLISSPADSLGYILADAGHDVWLGNMRGNSYSSVKNWNFNWDQMAQYDLPAMINYVTKETEREQVVYIGHSQGTMVGFAQFTEGSTIAAKIKLFIALAPVAFLGDTESDLLQLVAKIPGLRSMVKLFKLRKFDVKGLPDFVCQAVPRLCEDPLCLVAGCDGKMDSTRIREVFKHYPDVTSWENMLHYQQAIKTDKFQKYDMGRKKNMEVYGSPTPPQYNPAALAVPSILVYGGRDKLADAGDVAHLRSLLPSGQHIVVEKISEYGHADFTWGLDAKTRLYPRLLNAIDAAARGDSPESFLAEIQDDTLLSQQQQQKSNRIAVFFGIAAAACVVVGLAVVIVRQRRRVFTSQAFQELIDPLYAHTQA